MIDSRYIKLLIYLNGKSITAIALDAGVDPTNLSRFLKGHSTVSDEKMEKVLEHLGVDPVTGTLKPVVHKWKVNPAKFNLIEFEKLILDLVPGGGDIIMLALKKDYYRWSTIVGNNGTRIIMDDAILPFVRSEQSARGPEEGYEREPKEIFPEWKISYRIITPDTLKKLIGNETLTPLQFDEILGLNYGTPLSDGVSFAREDKAENSWTWDLILKKAKEAGLKPEEVAKRLGL
jgi:transcriptional regulator with XRE-family HTH domain